MISKIEKVMRDVFSIDDKQIINNDSSQDSISNWDSLRHIQLVVSLEEEFEIEFSDSEITEITNFASIVKVIESKKKNI